VLGWFNSVFIVPHGLLMNVFDWGLLITHTLPIPVMVFVFRNGHGGVAAAAARSNLHHRAERLMLRAQDLVLDYRSGASVAHAVNTVSLAVERGSFVGLIGPSGSGKSSLMYLLSGLKRPTRGRVTFDEQEYGAMSIPGIMRLRRHRFGFVFQQHFLINYLSALENVMVGAVRRNHDTAAYAQELLRRVGLGDKMRNRPYELSIGERQRVAVARAMVHRPAVVHGAPVKARPTRQVDGERAGGGVDAGFRLLIRGCLDGRLVEVGADGAGALP